MMKKTIVFLILLFISAGLFIAWEGLVFLNQSPAMLQSQDLNPASLKSPQLFEVEKGETLRTVAKRLESSGFISDHFKFFLMARIMKKTNIRMGEYALKQSMFPEEVLNVLLTGQSVARTMVIQEGFNKFEIARIFERKKICSFEEFLSYVDNPAMIKELLAPIINQKNIDISKIDSLEGYLFPETYHITKYTKAKTLIRQMVQNFLETYKSIEHLHSPRSKKLTLPQVVALASIVEKETGAPEERGTISSVYHNRLEKPMRLQADPTVLYGLWVKNKSFKKNLTRADLKNPTPYNTYTNMGLPKGPIANPGKDSLIAALNPKNTPYFYFVSRNDGTHSFSENYEQHLKAVKAFQLNRKAREGKSWRMLKQRKKLNPDPERFPAKSTTKNK